MPDSNNVSDLDNIIQFETRKHTKNPENTQTYDYQQKPADNQPNLEEIDTGILYIGGNKTGNSKVSYLFGKNNQEAKKTYHSDMTSNDFTLTFYSDLDSTKEQSGFIVKCSDNSNIEEIAENVCNKAYEIIPENKGVVREVSIYCPEYSEGIADIRRLLDSRDIRYRIIMNIGSVDFNPATGNCVDHEYTTDQNAINKDTINKDNYLKRREQTEEMFR